MDWQELALASHFDTAVAIRKALKEGNMTEANAGLEELIEALSSSDERALESHLIRLIQHIVKWHVQPEQRTGSWVATIREQRSQIRKLQKRNPRFTDHRIQEQFWEDCLDSGHNEAAVDMDRESVPWVELSWHDVFEAEYRLED